MVLHFHPKRAIFKKDRPPTYPHHPPIPTHDLFVGSLSYRQEGTEDVESEDFHAAHSRVVQASRRVCGALWESQRGAPWRIFCLLARSRKTRFPDQKVGLGRFSGPWGGWGGVPKVKPWDKWVVPTKLPAKLPTNLLLHPATHPPHPTHPPTDLPTHPPTHPPTCPPQPCPRFQLHPEAYRDVQSAWLVWTHRRCESLETGKQVD